MTWTGVAVSLGAASLFLAFAAFISYIAPVHVLVLTRAGARVDADVKQQLWLFIPFRTRMLDNVIDVTTNRHQEPTYLQPGSSGRFVTPEEEGLLLLKGELGGLEISTSPRDLYEVERRVRQFLSRPEPRLRVWIVSNWKVAVVLQTLILLPAQLLLLGVVWDLLR